MVLFTSWLFLLQNSMAKHFWKQQSCNIIFSLRILAQFLPSGYYANSRPEVTELIFLKVWNQDENKKYSRSLWTKDKMGRTRNCCSQLFQSLFLWYLTCPSNICFYPSQWQAFCIPEEGSQCTHTVSYPLTTGTL